ncbi:hypothetical protein Tco_0072512 [Tanacetum coccineum]
MIGSLMYLTSSRPDIMFAVCACSRFQVQPKASHMHAVKRIFRYLKGQPTLGLWYPKDSPLDMIPILTVIIGAILGQKSTTGDTAGGKTLYCLVTLGSVSTDVYKLLSVCRKESKENRKGCHYSSILEVEAGNIGNIKKDPSMATLNGSSPYGIDSGSGPRTSDDTEVLLEEEEPTKIVKDQGSGEKGEKEVTTADIALNTANASISTISAPRVYTTEDISGAAETLVYIRRSAEKRKDKVFMRKRKHRFCRMKNMQTKLKLNGLLKKKEYLKKQSRQMKGKKVINWNDPDVLRYHAVQNRPFSVAERSGFDLQQEPKKAEGSLKRKTSKDRMDITKKQKTDKQAEVD